jgi:hypothetical protein
MPPSRTALPVQGLHAVSAALLLVGALCTSTGCDYLDASSKYELEADAQCWEAAGAMNTLNRLARQDVRYSCVTRAELQRLRRAPHGPVRHRKLPMPQL